MKRPPLWTTLIPLCLAGAGYYHWWSLQRDAFVADVAAIVGSNGVGGGFPYRIEVSLPKPALNFDRAGATATLTADRLVLNRQPLGDGPVVGQMLKPRVTLTVPIIRGARLAIDAQSSSSSLRMDGSHIARFSTVFDTARLQFAWLSAAVTADSFEAHLRETPAAAGPATDPKFPVQGELVLAATALRYGKGDLLRFAASIDLTAARPVRRLADWRSGGTIEVRRFQLNDKVGEILNLSATASPGAEGELLVVGTIDTVCPATVEAVFAGQMASPEQRARRAIRYAFAGSFGKLKLTPVGISRGPVRNQEPPCPVLRR